MEKKLILNLNKHDIYYIKNDVINYYIAIPKVFNQTNICVELKSKINNYNLEENDELWVIENIKNTFTYIDDYNITLILPILKNEEVSILEKIDTTQYEIINRLFGYLLNNAYAVLKEHNINILKEIILVNNERYKTFITWFVTKYQNRVLCKNLLDIIQLFNVNATSYKKLETPVMTFVVGSYNSEVNAPKAFKKDNDALANKTTENLQPAYSSGFSTYWLLAILTILVSAIIAILAFSSKF